jgi:hypothetical protein
MFDTETGWVHRDDDYFQVYDAGYLTRYPIHHELTMTLMKEVNFSRLDFSL